MSITYTPTTNFGSKDSLPSNDPNKVIKGSEFTTEFTAIQSAFGLAAPTSNPTFSGTATYNNLTVSGSFTSKGIDDNATSTVITVKDNKKVGIGATDPDQALHMYASTPVIKMEHLANNSSRMYFSSTTDGDWGSLRAANTSGARTIELTPSSGVGDARFGGLSLGTASATIGGEFATAYPLTVTGSIFSETDYPAFDSRPTTGNGARLVASANKMLLAQINNAGAYVSDIYTSKLTDTGPTAHQWFTQGSGEVLSINDSGNVKVVAGDLVVQKPFANGTKVSLSNASTEAYVSASRAGANSSEARLRSYGNAAGLSLTNNNGTTATIDNLSTSKLAIYMPDVVNATTAFGRGSDEFMRITDAGTVGIGTSSPSSFALLEVQANAANGKSGSGLLQLRNTAADGTSIAFYNPTNDWSFGTNAAADVSLYNIDSNVTPFTVYKDAPNASLRLQSTGPVIQGVVGIGQSANLTDTLTIGDSGYAANQTERMRVVIGDTAGSHVSAGFGIKTNGSGSSRLSIETATGSSGDLLEVITATSAGDVGIGTDAPTNALEVEANATNGRSGSGLLTLKNTAAGLCSIQLENTENDWSFGTNTTGSLIAYNITAGVTPFIVNKDAAGGTLRLQSSGAAFEGQTLFGKTSTANTIAGTQIGLSGASGRIINAKTDTGLKDSLMNYHNGTYIGGVRYTDTASSFPTSSDVRLKDNIVDAPAGNIDALKVRSFDWKVNGEHQEYGFVAQELEAVAPYAVSSCGTEDAMLAVDYSKLVPMLVKEIQDLKAEVEALKNA